MLGLGTPLLKEQSATPRDVLRLSKFGEVDAISLLTRAKVRRNLALRWRPPRRLAFCGGGPSSEVWSLLARIGLYDGCRGQVRRF
ncbi:hypothetical protein BASA60_000743 [Batrachochytrium salamandrivorans]|nr:hypothetical protein BASA60_000743 [Batrachochytrium salamandrivorans]